MVECHIIIAAPSYDAARPVLDSLAARLSSHLHRFEVIVATGANPPRQRNAALARATGKFVWFLDSDCMVDANSLLAVQNYLAWDEFDIVGGPVLLPEGAGWRQYWFQAAMSHPAVTGPSASRYAGRGARRRATERELILANLLVRRELFERNGPLNEQLYPNEENEWMDRLEPGVRFCYEPGMAVRRPQRDTWSAFTFMMLRYGAGRVRQFSFDHRFNVKLVMPLFLAVWVAALAAAFRWTAGLTLLAGLLYPLLLMLGRPRHLSGWRSWVMIAVAAEVLLIAYALGQILGWLGWPWIKRGGEPVTLYDGEGRKL